jgi:hypothetical protein
MSVRMIKRGYLGARCKGVSCCDVVCSNDRGVLELVLRNRAGIVSESHVVHPSPHQIILVNHIVSLVCVSSVS